MEHLTISVKRVFSHDVQYSFFHLGYKRLRPRRPFIGRVARLRRPLEYSSIVIRVEIKPGETFKFEPGSSHLMFVGLTQPLHNGDTVKGTLKFEHAGTVEIEYRVLSLGAKGPPQGTDDHEAIRNSSTAPVHSHLSGLRLSGLGADA
jgi:hypothetical protein